MTTNREKPGLWERTKDVAVTYTGTFIVVMILNQLLFFGFCLNPICLIAAMPHVLLITVFVGSIVNKIGNWGERGLATKGARIAGNKLEKIGDTLVTTSKNFEEEMIKLRREEEQKRQKDRLRGLQHQREMLEQMDQDDGRSTPSNDYSTKEIEQYRKLLDKAHDDTGASLNIANQKPSTRTKDNSTTFQKDNVGNNNPLNISSTQGHQKVHITRSKLSGIAYEMGKDKSKKTSYDHVYKRDLKPLFNQQELALLSVFQEMCENPEQAFSSYKKLQNNYSSEKYVFQNGVPAYHADKRCELLHNDYFNLEMPVEIKNRGKAEIVRFRKFCKENRELIHEENPLVLIKLEAQFFLKNPPTKIAAKNSGVTQFDNMDLQQLEAEIDGLLFDAEKFRYKDQSTFMTVRDHGYGSSRLDEAKDPSSPLYEWHNKYKVPIKDLLMHYFRVRFNPELAFSGHLLDQLGFKPCSKCS
jgi:hypothetical protein